MKTTADIINLLYVIFTINENINKNNIIYIYKKKYKMFNEIKIEQDELLFQDLSFIIKDLKKFSTKIDFDDLEILLLNHLFKFKFVFFIDEEYVYNNENDNFINFAENYLDNKNYFYKNNLKLNNNIILESDLLNDLLKDIYFNVIKYDKSIIKRYNQINKTKSIKNILFYFSIFLIVIIIWYLNKKSLLILF